MGSPYSISKYYSWTNNSHATNRNTVEKYKSTIPYSHAKPSVTARVYKRGEKQYAKYTEPCGGF